MIPRYQRILFWVLLLASVAMAAVLIRLRERAADRLAGVQESGDAAEFSASPNAAPLEAVTLLEANDLDDTVVPVTRQLALPQETGARARVLLRQLFADYAAPGSKHPLPAAAVAATGLAGSGVAGPGVDSGVEEVFFMPVAAADKPGATPANPDAQTAIVNLAAAFAENHPSGIEPETLTLLSIIATLHENFPAVEQVRFLVDGQRRETLAGHADLTRAYLAGEGPAEP
jgi:hypothetical protein